MLLFEDDDCCSESKSFEFIRFIADPFGEDIGCFPFGDATEEEDAAAAELVVELELEVGGDFGIATRRHGLRASICTFSAYSSKFRGRLEPGSTPLLGEEGGGGLLLLPSAALSVASANEGAF